MEVMVAKSVLFLMFLPLLKSSCCLTLKTHCETQDATLNPVIKARLGQLQGSVLKSDRGRDIYAFRNIPYAKPPVGELRFQRPQPIGPWSGTLNATVDGDICVQIDTLFTSDVIGVEDCLYLNVYIPQLPNSRNSSKFAVMVYIHGGAYLTGGSTSVYYGPQRLLDMDVILVTFNYRLGPFGFLSTEDEIAPGNFGLWDQNLALNWVKDHIDEFGGDPKRVTIFGQSAGGVSTVFHMISPLSKGLFTSAIYQSGTAVTKRYVELNPMKYSKRLADTLNCPINNSSVIIQCLLSKPAVEILAKGALFYKGQECQMLVFSPVIDASYGGPVFLPGVPHDLMAKGQFNAVPVIGGSVKHEGISFYIQNLKKMSTVSEDVFSIDNLLHAASILVPDLMMDHINGQSVTKEIIDEYFKDIDRSNQLQFATRLIDFVSDSMIKERIDITNELIAKSGVPVYAYKLTYHGKDSAFKLLVKGKFLEVYNLLNEMNPVDHQDDLQYLCHWTRVFPNTNLMENDRKMADIILTYWTNFAKTGVPSLHGLIDMNETVNWPKVIPGNFSFMNLALNPQVVQGKLSSQPELWDKALNQIKWPEQN